MFDQGGIISCIVPFGKRPAVRFPYLRVIKGLGRLDRPQDIAIQGPSGQ